MTVWTIYNHGTDASSLKTPDTGEIVNLFGNNDRHPPFRGKIITEGVGSIGDPEKIAFEFRRDAKSGAYSLAHSAPGDPNAKGTLSQSMTPRKVNQAAGWGVQENVDSTVEVIRALNLAGSKPSTINMLGWSRGAVTCLRIAYKLYHSQDPVLRNIPINIFAVDPVAGAGHSTELDARTITPNVNNYFATLATGETRRFFKPIAGHRLIITDPRKTTVWVVPMPGDHSDTAKMDNNVGKIVFSLAYRFLTACGTQVPAMRHYSLDNLATWRLYEEVMVGAASVRTTSLGQQVLFGGVAYRRDAEASAHNFGESFFPNLHARLVFAKAYPTTYAYMTRARERDRNKQAPRVVGEMRANGMSDAMQSRIITLSTNGGTVGMSYAHVDVDLMNLELRLID